MIFAIVKMVEDDGLRAVARAETRTQYEPLAEVACKEHGGVWRFYDGAHSGWAAECSNGWNISLERRGQ